ncbi:WD repeat-containing protein 34 [Polyodon spathula]|uniref:WD repeat-containing protein 34 n=1 Tax=Polyodon spathula TaxID=7913 RepID=UPI001B7DAB53|nr:WD repeat-containing protein 34 [Polyodon spathula]
MFTDETLEAVGAESLWRRSRLLQQESKTCQTAEFKTAEVEVQARHSSDNAAQTEADQHRTQLFDLERESHMHYPGLGDFLHSVEDTVVKELKKNAKSHAFEGFEVNWEDQNETVSCLHALQYSEAQERELQVTSLSWNTTGSVVACAYGRLDDGDWSTEKSFVCTWNLDRRGLNPKRPDLVIDVPTSVMCLSFHPSKPSLIAGGLYSGEVLVWDTSRTQDPLCARTAMSDETHREPVYQVHWVPGARRGDGFSVLSAGADGRILVWQLDSEGQLTLSDGFALVTQQIPRNVQLSKARGDCLLGVTALSLCPWDWNVFLVGVEGGLVLKCSFSTRTPAAVSSPSSGLALRAPAQFTFSSHAGPIHAIHCSPFHRNLFLSAGMDGHAHLRSLLQATPLLSLRLSDSYLFSVRWSPTRPLVFAASTGQGSLVIFDLGRGSLRPAATIEQDTGGKPVYCLEFNPKQPHLLAAGSADGTVKIWQLSAELIEQGQREAAQLEQLATEAMQ